MGTLEWYVDEILRYQKYFFKTVDCNLYLGYRSLWESDQTVFILGDTRFGCPTFSDAKVIAAFTW